MRGPLAVVAAHPDDEVLGCGGVVARVAAEGREAHVAILGEGATARERTRPEGSAAVTRLAVQAQDAAAILGASSVRLSGLPDNRFDSVDLLDIVKLVEEFLDDVRPATVLCHHGGDVNVDHRLTFEAVLAATRRLPGSGISVVATFEVASSTEWAYQRLGTPFHPNLFVDVTASLDRKLAAMAAYAEEVRPFPHPRSFESLRAQAQRWGSAAGVEAAEAFEIVRSVW